MLTLSYRLISNNAFINTMRKLSGVSGLPPKTAYTLSKLGTKLDKLLPQLSEEYRAVLKQYVVLTEAGEIAPQKTKHLDKDGKEVELEIPGSFIPKPETEKEFQEALEKFMNTNMAFEYNKIAVEDLSAAKLSPNEYTDIADILTELELVK